MKWNEYLLEHDIINEDVVPIGDAIMILAQAFGILGTIGAVGMGIVNYTTGEPWEQKKIRNILKNPIGFLVKKFKGWNTVRKLLKDPEVVKLAMKYGKGTETNRKKIALEIKDRAEKVLSKTERQDMLKAIRTVAKVEQKKIKKENQPIVKELKKDPKFKQIIVDADDEMFEMADVMAKMMEYIKKKYPDLPKEQVFDVMYDAALRP